ncbi:penicillin-binding protein 2 [Chakrabartia godavariana]|nr:penicillin-binding protein 2 [Chakrabartia godavariana]
MDPLKLLFGAKRQVTEAQQQFTFSRRAFFLGGTQIGIGALLATRMTWLAVAENEKYSLLAESNRVNLQIMPPRRGWIVDRKGHPIALNRTAFRVDLIPDRLVDRDGVINELAQIMRLTPVDVERVRADLKKAAGFQPVPVAENVDGETFAAVSLRTPEMPGVAPSEFFTRYYPEGASVGHLIGYVGAASAKDYEDRRDPLLITPGFKIGKAGLEKTQEATLRGAPGAKRTEVTARGKLVRDLATRPDVPGKTVRLTIDAGLQAYTGRRLGLESGSAVVIDCETGGILTLSSMPCFDPNSFSDGIGRTEWKMLQEDDHIPMLNKTMQGLYPPGSTVKPAAALALLQHGVDPEEIVFCNGGYRLGSRTFRCLGHHGPMNMRHALMKSCNTYFYSMGRRIGYDRIAPVARLLGLGKEFELPMPSQRYGTVPDSAWKKRKFDQEWSQSDTLNATIGQGYVQVSPLQLAVLAARVASGKMLEPYLIHGQQKPARPLPFTPEQLQVVRDGMDLVVNGAGTAVRSRLPIDGVRMAGKTGTAQVRGIKGAQRGQSGAWKYRDHGLFVFFTPVDRPKYAGAVVIEHGMGGARAAAPVAKSMMTYMFDPAKAMEELTALEAGWGGDVNTRMARKSAAWKTANDPEAAAEAAQGSVEDAEVKKTTEGDAARTSETPVNRDAAATPEPETASGPLTPAPQAPPATGAPQ